MGYPESVSVGKGLTAAASTSGLAALFDELAEQGVPAGALVAGSGIPINWPESPDRALSHYERLSLFDNARRLARRPDTGLRAGARQKISDFGLYGYAMATSATLGEAFKFGFEHLMLAGTLLRITFEIQGNTGVLRSHSPQSLGAVLPFVAEFWRSSMTTLMGLLLKAPFPTRAMFFPYEAPGHAAAYRRTFGCPIHFGSGVMEWHFDAAILDAALPDANAMTAGICREFCERVVSGGAGHTPLQRQVRAACLDTQGRQATAAGVAASLGMSLRTFHRRLRAERVSFQQLLNEVRSAIAVEYLSNTLMPVEEVGHRIGFSDAANFRKAFRQWTGKSPSAYRQSIST
jgi:AraC-like DNA-binding protein